MTQMMCWQEGNEPDGAWHIGSEFDVITTFRTAVSINDVLAEYDVKPIRHYHTGNLELVPTAWLRPYPISEIAQP